jgi:hypothetical protein
MTVDGSLRASMNFLPLRRRLSLQPLNRVQDPVPRLGAGLGVKRLSPDRGMCQDGRGEG